MREIKFRAWVSEYGIMIHSINNYMDCNFHFTEKGIGLFVDEWINDDTGCIQKELDVPMMQYIGLKDKNGKEIYEGDILKRIFDDGNIIGHVDYVDGISAFRFLPLSTKKYGTGPHRINDRDYKVIGNIYENPELLGAVK